MEIYLLRHAVAVEAEAFRGEDSERPLTPDGKKKMRRAAKGMLALGLSFDLILTSPYRRARETADIVAGIYKKRRLVQCNDLLKPGGDRKSLVEHIAQPGDAAQNVLLVGHEPHLSQLLTTLIGASASAVKLKKGALGCLSTERLRHSACAKLEWLMTARQLAAIADALR
jgi:phosphohistidine phosphatase